MSLLTLTYGTASLPDRSLQALNSLRRKESFTSLNVDTCRDVLDQNELPRNLNVIRDHSLSEWLVPGILIPHRTISSL